MTWKAPIKGYVSRPFHEVFKETKEKDQYSLVCQEAITQAYGSAVTDLAVRSVGEYHLRRHPDLSPFRVNPEAQWLGELQPTLEELLPFTDYFSSTVDGV